MGLSYITRAYHLCASESCIMLAYFTPSLIHLLASCVDEWLMSASAGTFNEELSSRR